MKEKSHTCRQCGPEALNTSQIRFYVYVNWTVFLGEVRKRREKINKYDGRLESCQGLLNAFWDDKQIKVFYKFKYYLILIFIT